MSNFTQTGLSGPAANTRAEGEHFDLRAARGLAVVMALSVASWIAIASLL